MLWKIALKNMKSQRLAYCMIFMLLTIITLMVLVLTSAVSVKFKKYASVAKYMKQNGFLVTSEYLQTLYDEVQVFLRDEKEITAQFPEVKDVLYVAEVLEPYAPEVEGNLSVWCYNKNVIDLLQPSMMAGRWFTKEDQHSDTLKAVVTYNEGRLSVGDTVTVKSGLTPNAQVEVEIVGVLNNDESLFYNVTDKRDYRDCFYTYDYEAEGGNMVLILSDEQILNGEDRGKFSALNYRLDVINGFQRQVRGVTLFTFNGSISDKELLNFQEELKRNSMVKRIYPLERVYKNSKKYIYEDVRKYLPIIFCFFIFVLIAVSSAHIVSAKKKMTDYAIYYMCGLNWLKCCAISLYSSVILVVASLCFIGITYGILILLGAVNFAVNSTLFVYAVVVFAIDLLFIIISWITPFLITKNHSAVMIIRKI